MMRKTVKWFLGVLAALIVVFAVGLSYLRFADLGRHVGIIEDLLTDAVGHEVEIDKDLDIVVGEITTVTADTLTISNLRWDHDQAIVRTGRMRLSVDTMSLYDPPIVIKQLEIDSLDLSLVTNADGAGNWVMATAGSDTGDNSDVEIHVERLTMKDIELQYGKLNAHLSGEIMGSLSLSFREPLNLSAELVAESLELVTTSMEDDDDEATIKPLFSDKPFDTEIFNTLGATVSVEIEQFVNNEQLFNNVAMNANLNESGLSVSPLSFESLNGSATTTTTFIPVDKEIEVHTTIEATGLRIGTLWSDEATPESLPETGGTLQLTGRGSSWHQVMSSATGELTVEQGPGRLREIAGVGLFGDVIVQVFQTLNPLSKDKPYTDLECAYYSINLVDGLATIDDLRVQTDDMMIVGDGRVVLSDERIDVSMRAKPREGLGISLGGVANSFLKLGGVLSSPELQLDAAGGAATTGVAVATGGLSLLARGLWDRLSAVNDICSAVDDEAPLQQ